MEKLGEYDYVLWKYLDPRLPATGFQWRTGGVQPRPSNISSVLHPLTVPEENSALYYNSILCSTCSSTCCYFEICVLSLFVRRENGNIDSLLSCDVVSLCVNTCLPAH